MKDYTSNSRPRKPKPKPTEDIDIISNIDKNDKISQINIAKKTDEKASNDKTIDKQQLMSSVKIVNNENNDNPKLTPIFDQNLMLNIETKVNNAVNNALNLYLNDFSDSLLKIQKKVEETLKPVLYNAVLDINNIVTYKFTYTDISEEDDNTIIFQIPIDTFDCKIKERVNVTLNYYSLKYKSDMELIGFIPSPVVFLNQTNTALLIVCRDQPET